MRRGEAGEVWPFWSFRVKRRQILIKDCALRIRFRSGVNVFKFRPLQHWIHLWQAQILNFVTNEHAFEFCDKLAFRNIPVKRWLLFGEMWFVICPRAYTEALLFNSNLQVRWSDVPMASVHLNSPSWAQQLIQPRWILYLVSIVDVRLPLARRSVFGVRSKQWSCHFQQIGAV